MRRRYFGRAAIGTTLYVVVFACGSSSPQPEPTPTVLPNLPIQCVVDTDCRPLNLVCIFNRCQPPSTIPLDGGELGCPTPCTVDQSCVGSVCITGADASPPSAALPPPSATAPPPNTGVDPCLQCPTGYECDPVIGVCSPPVVLPPPSP